MIRPARRIAHLRLASQRILGSSFTESADAVRSLLAMQAQDFSGAKWGVGLRVPGATDATVEGALASAQIVRSWVPRGTLHFCAAEDLDWMLTLLSPRLIASSKGRLAELGIDERTVDRADKIAVKKLADAVLTREQLLEAFTRGGVSTEGQRGYYLLWSLGQRKVICFGPPREKKQTFVLMDGWIKQRRRVPRAEALAELGWRYFAGHGPATLKDFAWWSGLAVADAKLALAAARPRLAERDLDGTPHWMAPDAEDRLASAASQLKGSLAVLPGFDEYLLGYQDRGAVLAPEHKDRVAPGGNGIFRPIIVHDGQVVGTWARPNPGAAIEAAPFAGLPGGATKGFARAITAYERFLGARSRPRPSSR